MRQRGRDEGHQHRRATPDADTITAPTDAPVRTVEDLFRLHREDVRRFLLARTGCPELAADLTSDVFVSALRHRAVDRTVPLTRGWLFTVAHRRLIDHWRRAAKAPERFAALGEPLTSSLESSIEVEETLTLLPEHHRTAVVRCYLQGYPLTTVADELGFSYRAAESLLARARRRLRSEMDVAPRAA